MHQKSTSTYEKQASESGTSAKATETAVTDIKRRFRLLICSPSNGGCDELTRRIKLMRKDRTSALHNIEAQRGHRFCIIRVGRSDSIHSDCDDVGFDAMVKTKIDQLICKKQSERSRSLMEHYNHLLTTENNLRKKIQMLKSGSSVNKNDASANA